MSKEKPIIFSAPMVRAILEGRKSMTRRIVKPQPNVIHAIHPDASITTNLIFSKGDQRIHCPYGVPGDRLWVKETFMGTKDCLSYRATDPRQVIEFGFDKWTPSIFMPRRASRITLEIVSVRVERIQGISVDDIYCEGCPIADEQGAAHWFLSLWQSIHGHGSWEQNPWVWVIEFGRIA